jgi:hypothetical protein
MFSCFLQDCHHSSVFIRQVDNSLIHIIGFFGSGA